MAGCTVCTLQRDAVRCSVRQVPQLLSGVGGVSLSKVRWPAVSPLKAWRCATPRHFGRPALRSAEESLKAPLPSLRTQTLDPAGLDIGALRPWSIWSTALTFALLHTPLWRQGCSSLASFLGFGNRKRKRPSSALQSFLCFWLQHDREDA